jgi:hypothetical protein
MAKTRDEWRLLEKEKKPDPVKWHGQLPQDREHGLLRDYSTPAANAFP